MRFDKDKHWIYIATHNKYQNNILPQLPQLISIYLLMNPDKANLYFQSKLSLDDILYCFFTIYQTDKDINILQTIVSIIEGEENV